MVAYNMATTGKHSQLLNGFSDYLGYKYWDKLVSKEYVKMSEQVALAYMGQYNLFPRLVDAEHCDISVKYNRVYPDFMLFTHNRFVVNDRDTLYIGKPNLIVEVWSDSNTEEEKMWKQSLYATSSITEHWYIEQTSNVVECWYGSKVLQNQTLTNFLRTADGIEFDLRHFSISV